MKLQRVVRIVGKEAVVFPGGIAGASLKRPDRLAEDQAVRVFPGGIAGASLKQEQARGVARVVVQVFPGGIAGASLKGAAGPQHRHPEDGFPRRNRRGLIEGPSRRRRR